MALVCGYSGWGEPGRGIGEEGNRTKHRKGFLCTPIFLSFGMKFVFPAYLCAVRADDLSEELAQETQVKWGQGSQMVSGWYKEDRGGGGLAPATRVTQVKRKLQDHHEKRNKWRKWMWRSWTKRIKDGAIRERRVSQTWQQHSSSKDWVNSLAVIYMECSVCVCVFRK